jgi:hypothetical protein
LTIKTGGLWVICRKYILRVLKLFNLQGVYLFFS